MIMIVNFYVFAKKRVIANFNMFQTVYRTEIIHENMVADFQYCIILYNYMDRISGIEITAYNDFIKIWVQDETVVGADF